MVCKVCAIFMHDWRRKLTSWITQLGLGVSQRWSNNGALSRVHFTSCLWNLGITIPACQSMGHLSVLSRVPLSIWVLTSTFLQTRIQLARYSSLASVTHPGITVCPPAPLYTIQILLCAIPVPYSHTSAPSCCACGQISVQCTIQEQLCTTMVPLCLVPGNYPAVDSIPAYNSTIHV